MPKSSSPNILTVLLAGVLAWLVPGAGHVYLRRTVRGLVVCVSVNGLFWAGVAFGGVFTVEPVTQKWWFAAQMCTGVSGLSSWYRQDRQRKLLLTDERLDPSHFEGLRRNERDAKWQRAYGEVLVEQKLSLDYPTDNVARAYSGVAGMLNLMCIFDAIMLALLGQFGEPPPARRKSQPREGTP